VATTAGLKTSPIAVPEKAPRSELVCASYFTSTFGPGQPGSDVTNSAGTKSSLSL
jgi:hypothetical protein